MYYRGAHWDPKAKKATHREVTCYAESKDGITWTKPELGLFEFDGSKANNIVWDGGRTSHNFTPFRDTNPKCPPGRFWCAMLPATFSQGPWTFRNTASSMPGRKRTWDGAA